MFEEKELKLQGMKCLQVSRHVFTVFLMVAVLTIASVSSNGGSVSRRHLHDPSDQGAPPLKHKPWLEKDWTTWTKTDCNIVMNSSPWTYLYSNSRAAPNQQQYGLEFGHEVELRSALPLREAVLRQLQLEKNYDKMKPEKKQAFDQEHAGDLVEKPDDPILVWVYHRVWTPAPSAGSNRPDEVYVHPPPARQVALVLPDGSYLTPTQTTLIQNSTFETEVLYAFSRIVNGKPAFASEDKGLVMVQGDPLPTNKGKELGPLAPQDFHPTHGLDAIGVSFVLSDLMYRGKLEY